MIILSPAKTLDLSSPMPLHTPSLNRFLPQAAKLAAQMQSYSAAEISAILSISPALARLNFSRFAEWKMEHTTDNSRAALFTYNGPVYDKLNAFGFDAATIDYAQKHLRIISGLYGLVRPLDGIQPYRLEMATTLDTEAGSTLYDYWGSTITQTLLNDMAAVGDEIIFNLASEEYAKAIVTKLLPRKMVTIHFKDSKNGKYKIIVLYAKYARGLMCKYILENRITEVDKIKQFNEEGYFYSEEHSTEDHIVFLR